MNKTPQSVRKANDTPKNGGFFCEQQYSFGTAGVRKRYVFMALPFGEYFFRQTKRTNNRSCSSFLLFVITVLEAKKSIIQSVQNPQFRVSVISQINIPWVSRSPYCFEIPCSVNIFLHRFCFGLGFQSKMFYFFLISFSCLSQSALIRLVRTLRSLLLQFLLRSIIPISLIPAE